MKQFTLIENQDSLDVLNYQIRACESYRLSLTQKHTLSGEVNINACIIFIALSPGAKGDVQNKMFVDPSGEVFNRLLAEAGIESCNFFLNQEIKIVQPKVIVPLGYF